VQGLWTAAFWLWFIIAGCVDLWKKGCAVHIFMLYPLQMKLDWRLALIAPAAFVSVLCVIAILYTPCSPDASPRAKSVGTAHGRSSMVTGMMMGIVTWHGHRYTDSEACGMPEAQPQQVDRTAGQRAMFWGAALLAAFSVCWVESVLVWSEVAGVQSGDSTGQVLALCLGAWTLVTTLLAWAERCGSRE
jgi:hypothetical protein